MREQIIKDFAEAWRTLNAELIIKNLDNKFVYDSQWVFESLDYNEYKDYIRGKFETLRVNNCCPEVEIVDDPHGDKMLSLKQNGNVCYFRLQTQNDKVIKGDMCMFKIVKYNLIFK